MLKKDIIIGAEYSAKVSNVMTTVRITAESGLGGWEAINLSTGRTIRIRSAGKLRSLVNMPKPNGNGNGHNGHTNGNGDKPITDRQQAFIEKLFDQREVTGNTVAAYATALKQNGITTKQASDFIKKLMSLPFKVEGAKQVIDHTPAIKQEVIEKHSAIAHVDTDNGMVADMDQLNAIADAIDMLAEFMPKATKRKANKMDAVLLTLTDILVANDYYAEEE